MRSVKELREKLSVPYGRRDEDVKRLTTFLLASLNAPSQMKVINEAISLFSPCAPFMTNRPLLISIGNVTQFVIL